MNFYKHHIGDYDADTAHLGWMEDAAYRRLICLYYRREQPIPSDLAQACRLVRAVSKPEREAVESVLREFFKLTEEGWRHKRCDEEITGAANKANANRSNGGKGGRPRKTKSEEQPTDNPQETQSVSGGFIRARGTNSQTPDTRHQTPDKENPGRATAVAPAPPEPPPEANGQEPTPAGRVCRAMKTAGLQAVNPGDPRLLELLKQGATPEEFQGLAAEAVGKGKGFAWVLAVLQARRKEAGDIALAPKVDTRSVTVAPAETVEQYQARMAEERAASREGIAKPPASVLALAGKLRVP